MTIPSYSQEVVDLYQLLDTSLDGLKTPQVAAKQKLFGPNKLPDPSIRSPLSILLSQLKSLMVYILAAAATISYLTGHMLDVYVILGIVVINTCVGFLQEIRAERSINKLKELILPTTLVRRDAQERKLPASELVPGDVILLVEGDKVPADCRIIECKNLAVDESLLTGESVPTEKKTGVVAANMPISERVNTLFMGTTVVRGTATALVTETALQAELGAIVTNLKSIKVQEDHFKTKTNTLAMQMSILAFVSTIVTFLIGYYVRGFAFADIFMVSIAALVSGIPEGLPVVLTIVLSISAERMAKKNAVVRRLSATETLSVVDTIITDKTGTLTKNQMTATQIMLATQMPIPIEDINGSDDFKFILGNLWHSHLKSTDPTETALRALGEPEQSFPAEVLDQLPFSQEHRYQASLITHPTRGTYGFVAGAPESMLKSSSLSQQDQDIVLHNLKLLAAQALRPVALAIKMLPGATTLNHSDLEDNLVYLGTVGLIDPARPEVKDALKQAHQAGITTIMATGDHPDTALAIAKNIGLVTSENDTVTTGQDLEDMTDQELVTSLTHCRVYARMTPRAKLRLVGALQQQGHIVAMTGDGVNDAPALKIANIGIAMGRKGTDVAREVSDIVLTDDNYASIIHAIKEGRTQKRNIRRTSFFLITTNIAESLSLIVFLLFGLPMPLLAKQILWLNVVTDGVTDIALATEPIHGDVLDSPPSAKQGNILNQSIIPFLTLITGIMITLSLLSFLYFQARGIETARTGVFVVLSFTQLCNLYNMRSLKESIFKVGFFTNRAINIAVIVSVLLLMLVVYNPLVGHLFELGGLTYLEFAILAMLSSTVLWGGELYKLTSHKAHI